MPGPVTTWSLTSVLPSGLVRQAKIAAVRRHHRKKLADQPLEGLGKYRQTTARPTGRHGIPHPPTGQLKGSIPRRRAPASSGASPVAEDPTMDEASLNVQDSDFHPQYVPLIF